ncbi:uncharacterized protein LOC122372573 [Amphibalanus amphitrite]|uniref:uncharacterized protein LOC122372573 n=1 Tax=Amphibalanus amphitrite TaxID=1232801 RepID=UPI001C9099AD|nr:uncharacterized protein LOC122372573 [Amphibalanus amphitrite]XP_043205872.1 uncharacterized protein LOC122372573 [Amphibalanus amphitrite]XP_043205873.1 uncharacterized protein LOC122372573 [Amphibalanus amphitrite]
MGKKEGKKASTPQVEQAPSEAPVVDETPWWEADFRGRSLDAEGFSWRLYMVREETDSDADLMAMLLSAVRSGVRRQFVLLEQEDVLKLVPEVKKPAPDPKQKAGGKASKREPPASHAVCGMPPEEGMLAAVGEVLRDNGRLDATSLAMVVKHALSLLLTERRAAAGAEDPLPIPASPEAASAGKAAKKKEVPAKKKKMSTKPEKTAAAEEDKSAEKDKSVDKEDKEFEAFCETRPSTLRKRGEALEPAYKDDEPPDGPDLYVLLVGFGEPRLPRELAACGVHVESLVALGSERCHLRNGASAASSDTDQAGWFWSELPAQLVDPIGGLEDTAVTRVAVDRCRVQFAPSATSAADQVYTAVAYEIYRLLRLRSLFERYVQSVTAVPVPDAPRPPPPPPESPPDEPMAELSVPNTPAGSEVELLEPCVQPPLEYRRLLEPLPPETVTVPLLVNALVEQVCVWAMPVWQRQQETPAPPTPNEPTPEPDCEELERRVALQEEFTPRIDDADRGPVLVYEGDDVNAAFWDWTDREPVLSAEHVLTQTAELQALQGRLPAPSGALWRHQAARQELRAAEDGPRSEPAAELLLRQLVFESMYPALTADCSGGGGGPLAYPHPFLPAQSVRPDRQQLAPECGHGQMEPDAQSLDTGDELLTPPAQFAEFCVSERLDRLTMAQALEAARDGRRRLAAYHFGGDDGLYLVYGHPRVRGGSLSDHWQRRAHTAVGLRDFIEHVQHWPEVRSWMQHQCGQLRNAFAPRQTPPSRPGSAASSAWPSPAELPPPGSGVQLPDAMFLVPGSLKYEASVRQERGEDEAPREPTQPATQPAPAPAAKQTDKKRKESRRRSSEQSPRKNSDKGHHREEGGSPSPPPPPPAAISVVQFEIRPHTPNAGARQRSPSPVPPPKVFEGYSVSLGRLLDVHGGRQRQYFGDGSHVTVRHSRYVHGPATLTVSVRRGETRLTLHPAGERPDLVAVLAGGILLHPQTVMREPQPPPQEPAPAPPPQEAPPPTPGSEEPPMSPPQSRRSVRHRSPPEKSKKKETKKEKKAEPKKAAGKKRQPAEEESPAPPLVEVPSGPPADECPDQPAEVAGRLVQTLRLSCPSGLVVELQPEPFWPGPEPRLRVVQYYVDAACERRRVRVYLSDGSLLLLHGADQPEDEVRVLSTDGGQTTYRRSDAGLTLVRAVTGAGRRLSWEPDAPPEPRPLLTKMATDPVTRELYLQREDGARAVVRPGGQSVLQLADGTRVTISPPPPPPVVAGAEPRPPGCSDYLVNESGWIGAATVTWLLGAQVTVDDATCAQRSVTIEHPEYARVEMDQAEARCRVRLPRGLLVEADSAGFFYLSQPDGSRLQLDDQVLCFSGPGDTGRRPVVHTLRLAPDGCGALCETVDGDGAVWHVTAEGRLEPVGAAPEPLPDPLPLHLRRQVELETVMAERPELFVLYRHGDGVRLMASDEAERYLEDVESTPGALAVQEPHQQDDELTVVKTFRPVGTTLAERWRVPYREATIVPPNLRCRDLQLLCRDAEPPQAGATVWGGGEPVAGAGSPPPPRLPSGLVCTRELLVSPPLPEPRRLAVLRAVNALRLRWRSESDGDGQLPADEPPLTHVQHVYEPDRLLNWLSSTASPSPAPVQTVDEPTQRHRHRRSRAPSAAVDIRELDKILIYREMLRRRRFPGFFLTADGRQFLATLRQTPPEERPAPARRRLKHEPLRLVAAARGEPPLPPVGSGAVLCRPERLDLGLVRPDRAVCAELALCSTADTPLTFRVIPPGPPVGVRVWPELGVLPAGGQAVLRVQLTPSAAVRSRSVFCLLEVVVDDGAQRLSVPVVACVAAGGAAQMLPDSAGRCHLGARV